MTYILHETDAEGLPFQPLEWNRGDYQNLMNYTSGGRGDVDR